MKQKVETHMTNVGKGKHPIYRSGCSGLPPESVFAKVISMMIKCSLGCLRGTQVRLLDEMETGL